MNGKNPAAGRTGIFVSLPLHKFFQAILSDSGAVTHKARTVAGVVTLFQGLNLFTGVIRTFETIGMAAFPDAVLYFTFPAVLRLSLVTVQTARTGFSVITVLITDHTVHSAWGEHERVNYPGHFQLAAPLH